MGRRSPGNIDQSPISAAAALFPPVQRRVLGLLFGQPFRRFQSAELIRLAKSGTGATHRILKRLARSGLVAETTEGRFRYYQANGESPIFEEVRGLILKTVGIVEPLAEALASIRDHIRAAFVYGSVASREEGPESDIDLLVVSDELDYPMLYDALIVAEGQLGRRINPHLTTTKQWNTKRDEPDSFIARLCAKPRLFVVGNECDLQ